MKINYSSPKAWVTLSKTVKQFYNTKDPDSIREVDNFRTAIGSTIAQVERLFAGMFGEKLGSDLMIADYKTFSRVFPNVYRSLNGKYALWKDSIMINGIRNITILIESIRNVNMHVKGYYKYKKHYTIPEEFRCFYEYNKNPHITYITQDGQLTVGGMLFTIFSFCNESMFKSAQKTGDFLIKSFLASLIPGDGLIRMADPKDLVEIFGTRFEEDIRPYVPNQSLEQAIGGKYYPLFFKEDGSFDISLEVSDHYTRGISGYVYENEDGCDAVHINKGSNLGEFFTRDYDLTIIDRDGFIEASSKVPPFQLISYLFKKGTNTFTEGCLLEHDWKVEEDDRYPYLKLNKPKFYVDKNIRILALKNTDADIRAVHTAIQPKLNRLFIILERNLYKKHNIPDQNYYSSLRDAFTFLNIDAKVADKFIVVRNFFAHQNILGDKAKFFGVWIPIDISFILNTFREFLDELAKVDSETAEHLEQGLVNTVITSLLVFKYHDICNFWADVKGDKDVPELNATAAKYTLRMDSSIINDALEEKFGNFIKRGFVYSRGLTIYESIHKYTVINNTGKPFTFGSKKIEGERITIALYEPLEWSSELVGHLIEEKDSCYVHSCTIEIDE